MRRLFAEHLEPRCLLSAEAGLALLFSGIAPSPVSSTNSGLLIAADVASGMVAPLHASFSSISDRAHGWNLPHGAGFTGLAFGPGAQDLLGAASSATQSASNLLTMDPYTGVQRVAPQPIRAAGQALHISDLATIPGASYQLYGLGRPASTPNASFQLYGIDPGSGQAVATADQPTWLASLSVADALALGPDGTIYVAGLETLGNTAVLYTQQPTGGDPLVTRHTLTERIVGMDARVAGSDTQTGQIEVLTSVEAGHLRWLDPASGQFTSTVALSAPVRGVAGDIAFLPAPDSLILEAVHHADFETGTDGYTADNAIHVMPGMWHYSPGRWDDRLINHTHGQQKTPGFNWYYGQFETSLGGGTYLTDYHHAGMLASPPISVPECATTTLSFSYLLDVRPPLDADFVEVWAQFADDAGQTQRTRLLSRAEGTLPQTGNRWLTATADLSPFAGREVQIQFLFDTGNVPDVDPEGWYVDDVVVASMPKAVCGYKWADQNFDGHWDADEPGLNEWTVYIDLDGNGRYDPAASEQTFAGQVDANTLGSAQQVFQPEGQVVLEVSATGEPIWAMPDPTQPTRNVLARGTEPGEETWPVGPMLRANFPVAVHTATLDVARAHPVGPTRVVLQAFDPHGNRIAEQVQTLTDNQWQTLTISTVGGQIAYVKASVDLGAAHFNHLRYLGTAPAVEGDPAFITRNDGRHDGAFWFDRLPPGEYTLREVLPEGWKQWYPGPETYSHQITVTAGRSIEGSWGVAESPNFGNSPVDISGYKWHDVNYNGYWDQDEHEGLNGWRIELYHDTNGNGVLDADEPLVDWTTTQWDGQRHGAFWFAGLSAGDYILREVLPDQWEQTYPGGEDLEHAVTLVPGQQIAGSWQQTEQPNFGNARPPLIAIEKLVSPDNGQTWNPASDLPGPDVYQGTEPHFKLVVTNRGLVDLENVTLTDPSVSEFLPSLPAVLPAGSSFTTFAVGVWQAGQQENVATASGSHRNRTAQDTDNAFYFGAQPEIALVKQGTFLDENGDGFANVGETIAYEFIVSNPGNVTLRNVELIDARLGQTVPIDELAPGEVWVRTLDYALTQQDIDGKTIENTATVAARDPKGDLVADEDRHLVELSWNLSMEMSKTGTLDPFSNGDVVPGRIISYTFTVSNESNVTLRDVELSDPLVSPIVFEGGDTNGNGLLDVGEVWTYTATYAVTQQDIDAGEVTNVATVTANAPDGQPVGDEDEHTERLPVPPVQPPIQTVQFITPISVYRPNGPSQPLPPETGPTSIQGYVWQDLNQNGRQDQGEPGAAGWSVFLTNMADGTQEVTVTEADGRYVFDPAPGAYSIRFDRFGMSDGTFELITFPDSGGYVVEVSANGSEGVTVTPSEDLDFGIFVYSPFTRPADNHYGRIEETKYPRRDWLLSALEPWQSFPVTNTTGSDFEITEIRKEIDTTKIAVADQFVTVFLKQGETFIPILDAEPGADSSVIRVNPPIVVPGGETVQFFAFYDPAIREGDRVIEQYPDWYGANKHTHPAHTFTRHDHLNIMTNTDATFRVDLVGGSTYDSDIFYDGAVDRLDLNRVSDELLDNAWPIPEGVSPLFDPSSDINVRCPNGAESVLNTCTWPLVGHPRREIGLGDFGALNVEWNRARAPFLDLDPDNSSGASGVDYRGEFQGVPVEIADRDAAFANSIERDLVSLVAEIRGEANGDRLHVDEALLAALGITADGTNGTARLVLAGPASVDDYAAALREIRFQSDFPASRIVEIEIRAIGSSLGAPGNIFTDVEGNIALSTIIVTPPENSNITGVTDFDAFVIAEAEWAGESQASYTHVPAAMAVGDTDASDGASSTSSIKSHGWQNPENRYDVNGDRVVTPLDVLLIVNYLDADPAGTDLPFRAEDAPPYLDVNGDGHGTALDALLVINHLTAEEMSVAEGEAVGTITESPLVVRLFSGTDAQLATQGIPQQEVVRPVSVDRGQDSRIANDWPEIAVSTEANSIVPPAVVEQPSTPMTRKTSLADDASKYLDASLLDIEGLLNDLVDDIAAAGL